MNRLPTLLIALLTALALLAAACGSDAADTSATEETTTDAAEAEETEETPEAEETEAAMEMDSITVGYSAWPGWFPLAITQEAGIFEEVGLDVELIFFADYIASIDAMALGELDFVTQTLSDTMASVAFGSEQTVVVVNDNSTGNDKIICDESITSIEEMAGATIAAEAGVVDHFLLVQGLESVGLSEADIDFRGVLTDAAAASFAAGEFDCVGVFAPFWLTALEREGSAEVFSSADFPGLIPDAIVATSEIVGDNPVAVQKLVDAWYLTMEYMDANPEKSLEIMAATAETSVEDYLEFAEGTTLFSVEDALAAFEDGDTTASLAYTAGLINPFLVESGFTESEAPLEGLLDGSFTQNWFERMGG